MTLLDAPAFDAARDHRRRVILTSSAIAFVVLFIAAWLVSGRPVDWPWNWWTHFRGRIVASQFLTAVEQNDLQKAYGIWIADPNWQQHPNQQTGYPFSRFQQDWSSSSSSNEYGAVRSHKIVAARRSGNVLLIGILINGLQSHALFIDYDPHTHTLGFSPVELYLGP